MTWHDKIRGFATDQLNKDAFFVNMFAKPPYSAFGIRCNRVHLRQMQLIMNALSVQKSSLDAKELKRFNFVGNFTAPLVNPAKISSTSFSLSVAVKDDILDRVGKVEVHIFAFKQSKIFLKTLKNFVHVRNEL